MEFAPIVLTNHITVKAASLFSGYNIQYLRRLIRNELLFGLKVGQIWLIDKRVLDGYLGKTKNSNDSRFGLKSATIYWLGGGIVISCFSSVCKHLVPTLQSSH